LTTNGTAGILALMQLQTWLDKETVSQAELAAALAVNRATVSRWLSGDRVPRAKWLRAIAEYTGGKVRPRDWNGK
jgi:transcriptional regulator with XRE-family HTH domain